MRRAISSAEPRWFFSPNARIRGKTAPEKTEDNEEMSFLKRLFGGGGSESEAPAVVKEIEHKGFTIRATPYKRDGQYQTSGTVAKEIGGVVKEHKFIRADRFAGLDDAVEVSLAKGRQIVDEQGEKIFN
jgi:hypothetical protein